MRLLLLVLGLLILLGGCSSSDSVQERAELKREFKERTVDQVLENAPIWMLEIPYDDASTVYASGTAVSEDFSMAVGVARTNALEGICMASGGIVKSQTKVYRREVSSTSTAISTRAIKTICPAIDITGTKLVDYKVVPEHGRFRVYVLVGLPFGVARSITNDAEKSSEKEFKELDRATGQSKE